MHRLMAVLAAAVLRVAVEQQQKVVMVLLQAAQERNGDVSASAAPQTAHLGLR